MPSLSPTGSCLLLTSGVLLLAYEFIRPRKALAGAAGAGAIIGGGYLMIRQPWNEINPLVALLSAIAVCSVAVCLLIVSGIARANKRRDL